MKTRSMRTQCVAVLTVALLFAIGSWVAYANDPKPPHFKCYQLANAGGALNEDVTLIDQFHEEEVKLNNPHFLCTPVEEKCFKDDKKQESCEEFPPTEWHLLCWKIAPSGPPVGETVSTDGSQFEDREVKVQTGQLLCEPVKKIRNGKK